MEAFRDESRLRAIMRFESSLAEASPDFDGVMRLVAERAEKLTGATAAVVELAERDHMVYAAATGAARNHIGTRLPRGASLSGLCVTLNEVLRCDDTETDDRVDRQACRRIGVRSMLCVPLLHQERAVGVLKVMGSVPAQFDGDDVATLRILSGMIAARVSDASRFELAQQDRRTDELTGFERRRGFDERLSAEVSRALRYGHELSVMIVDVDDFKGVNDMLGRVAGDEVLLGVARVVREAVPAADGIFRVGGDEFAVILPAIGPDAARELRERIAGAVRAARLGNGEVTVSAGVGSFDRTRPYELASDADADLYAVKNAAARA